MTTIGAMLSRKALKDRPLRAPMMMLGGSPTNVAAPPMLEANTSAINSGTGLIVQRIAHQQGDGGDQQYRDDVGQQRRGRTPSPASAGS